MRSQYSVRDRPGARAAELEVGTYYCTGAICTKWRLIHPETPVELSVSLFDSLAEFIYSKGSSSVGYRVDWCKNHHLQSNQFVGRRDEEEVTSQVEKKKVFLPQGYITLRNNYTTHIHFTHAQERAPPIYMHRSSRLKAYSLTFIVLHFR